MSPKLRFVLLVVIGLIGFTNCTNQKKEKENNYPENSLQYYFLSLPVNLIENNLRAEILADSSTVIDTLNGYFHSEWFDGVESNFQFSIKTYDNNKFVGLKESVQQLCNSSTEIGFYKKDKEAWKDIT